MDHFIDIQIKPDAEMRENLLLNKVYTKLHKRLCELKSTDIGISFPQFNVILGKVIRIHSSEQKLTELQAAQWLDGLAGYCMINPVQNIPDDVQHRVISRIQSNMTESKLRRLIKRGSISANEVKAYKAKMFQKGLDNPYLDLESASNGHIHRRYLQFGELLTEPVSGVFDQFGLSKTATVPWF